MLIIIQSLLLATTASLCIADTPVPTQIRLVHDLLDNYDKKAKPMWDNSKPINVSFSMDLYQILELNEPQQYILLNAWIIERWFDEFLYWNPDDYENITELRLPYDSIWLPDTTLYNSLVMKDDDTRRLLNSKLTTDTHRRAALIELLYPTIYKFSCLLDLRFFPFDVQVCTMTFSSWTYDQKGIDYFPYSDKIGTSNYLENEGWYILQTKIKRQEVKYACCPNNYTLLQLTLYLRRKPLFYLVNLIIPTSIITLIAIVGFFTTSSASGMREEKVSLGITTLLSMSILMLMVSDQMPTTSTFIPLIGWFILAMIIVISLGTVVSSVIIAIQKRGSLGERMSKRALKFAKVLAWFTCTSLPPHVEKEHMMEAFDAPTPLVEVRPLQLASVKESVRNKWVSGARRATQRGNSGLALISDKSTDPLIHLSPTAHQPDESISPSAPPVPSSSPLPPPLTPGPADDVVSVASELSSKFLTSRMRPKSQKDNTFAAMQRAGLSRSSMRQGSIKANRQLAVAEFEWFATVVERTCFVIFVVAFLIITFGINFIGFIHWHQAGVEYGG
ncbi:Acetylcholine receptor DES-2-like protein [Caenorhabditis elegans]|uniref:Acetylcholine receptor DES-2-like protein n=1 Tax=Caenorhabditis elegans TaxID=6239 RepID=H9G2Y4_CAEEL|nr:Acetylcholine receptor DES-2-like protein [Caenorhabditis elegans]CCG28066.1 Acetylcholine receptor DES-2-like protein [Caenorhabditis elegans]|eukprot:NP_001256321.1 Acetylcholine receptor subunit alpha-type des-2 [Caenorhabditis elegans]